MTTNQAAHINGANSIKNNTNKFLKFKQIFNASFVEPVSFLETKHKGQSNEHIFGKNLHI